MAAFPRFSASFLLLAAVLALFLSVSSVAASSNKDEMQAEYLAERDLQSARIKRQSPPSSGAGSTKPKAAVTKSNVPKPKAAVPKSGPTKAKAPITKSSPTKQPLMKKQVITQAPLVSLTNQVAGAQAGFTFCKVYKNYMQTACPIKFPNPTNADFITPVVLPFANPVNNFMSCWGVKVDPWTCSEKNELGTYYGIYPNAYVGAYIEFPSGSLPALQADTLSTAARDAIIAVMEKFVYNVVTNMLGLGTSMNAQCGFPNIMVFGCKTPRKNNPQLNFGIETDKTGKVIPDGRVRLLIIFMVDWEQITSEGNIKTFADYQKTVKSFFNNKAKTAPLWDAALDTKGAGSSQFLGGGSRRALEKETGEEQEQEEEQEEGSLRKLPAVKRPPPKVTGSGVVKVVAVGGSK